MHALHPCVQLIHRKRPAGFTMVELMVVISIILLLLALGGMVIANSIAQAKQQATKSLLLKLDGMLQQRLDGFGTLMDKPQRRQELQTVGVTRVASRLSAAGMSNPAISAIPPSMKNLMAYKEYFRQAFPQTAADNPAIFAANAQNSAESSEYLYWIITQSESFGIAPVDDSEFSSTEVQDTDGDGLKEFVDAWGRPLRFYRWPTRLFRPAGPGSTITTGIANLLISGLPDPVDLQLDPDDAVGVYDSTVSGNDAPFTPALYESAYQTPDTWSIPLIVSCGADGQNANSLGLFEPYDTANFGYLAQPIPVVMANPGSSSLNDDLTNRQKTK